MTIKTSPFGGITLTGKSAEAFRKQFLENPKPNYKAQKALEEGRKLLKEMEENGFVVLKPNQYAGAMFSSEEEVGE